MFGLADIQFDVLSFTILSDNHTAVYFFARSDEKCSTVLCGEQTICNSFTCFECDQRSLFTVLEISLVWSVSVEGCVEDTGTLGGSKELSTETD